MLAEIFLHREPHAVAYALSKSLSEYRQTFHLTSTLQEVLASASLQAAEFILLQGAEHPAGDTPVADYVIGAVRHFNDALASGDDHPGESAYSVIFALVGLAGAFRALGEYETSIRSLQSANDHAYVITKDRPVTLEDVDESVVVTVDNPANSAIVHGGKLFKVKVTEKWNYRGHRPVRGSAARLLEDVEFALLVAQGKKPTTKDVYGRWARIVDSRG